MSRNNKPIQQKQGFTIIEVVLVLAVAGLIFLMVFIALPALQRTQRDTQRRNDYSMLSTAVTNYSTNNGGRLDRLVGSSGSKDLDPVTYINSSGTDPDGYTYDLKAYNWTTYAGASNPTPGNERTTATEAHCSGYTGSTAPTTEAASTSASGTWTPAASQNSPTSQVFVIVGADCTGEANGHNAPAQNTSSRAFAIYGYVEGGSQTFCLDKQ